MVTILMGEKAWEALKNAQVAGSAVDPDVARTVADIIETVRSGGDGALRKLAERFGDVVPERFEWTGEEVRRAVDSVPRASREVLERAAENIRSFGEAVVEAARPVRLVRDGFTVGMDFVPVDRAGCYVPGGRNPLPSSALMTAVTARVAGVREVAVVSPSDAPEILCAGFLAGADRFFRLGGAQAVAALALGTKSVPPVDLIAGPGNAFVTEAKRQFQGTVGIDLLAGPSEVGIIADSSANPDWTALDLIAQWEHDPEARAWLFTNSSRLAGEVASALESALETPVLPDHVRSSAAAAIFLVFDSLAECAEASNFAAPEHLQLSVSEPGNLKSSLKNAGAVFLGNGSPVPFGDYMAGPNHTLPTGRTARFAGGLSPLTFLRSRTWLQVGEGPSRLAQDTAAFARMEGLHAHASAAEARVQGGRR